MVVPRIGCSGWNYKTWRGHFYDRDLPPSQWLARYSTVFDTVEVNGTFYRLPESETFAAWREQTPAGFVMAVKASRYLTHLKRLKDPEEPIARLLGRAAALGPRLGPILYQLPGHMHCDLDRLDRFLSALPACIETPGETSRKQRRPLQHVMEFRHTSWYHAETFALLERHKVALCWHDKTDSEIDEPMVGPITYVRFHGTSGHYRGSYDARALERWAARLSEHATAGRPVYAYFNNDPDAVATENARALLAMLNAECRMLK
jgi:uncharacterized protein YecE (DUF72 family)